MPMTELVRPSLKHSIAGNIEVVDSALIMPPPSECTQEAIQTLPAGVLRGDGSFVPDSVTFRGKMPLNSAPPAPAEEEGITPMLGNFMFGGILFGHFGHALVESMARIWALDHIPEGLDGIIFIPKAHVNVSHILQGRTPIYRAFGVKEPLFCVETPTRVQRLYVPQQGFGVFDMIGGAPEFRDYIQRHAGRGIKPDGPRKIYISRTQLASQRGGLLGEPLLESWLQEAGYSPFYPEQHSIEEQIAAYRAAKFIISMDGSPLHLVAMVGRPDQKVVCISRRKGAMDQMFIDQFKAFQDNDLIVANCISNSWVPQGRKLPAHLGIGEASFSELWQILRDNGMIGGRKPWPDLTQKDRLRFLKPQEEYYSARFIRTKV